MTTNSRSRTGAAATATGHLRKGTRRHSGPPNAEKIERVVAMITACAEELSAAGFRETAEMLAIARLDLLARFHGVSDAELDQLIDAAAKARKAD